MVFPQTIQIYIYIYYNNVIIITITIIIIKNTKYIYVCVCVWNFKIIRIHGIFFKKAGTTTLETCNHVHHVGATRCPKMPWALFFAEPKSSLIAWPGASNPNHGRNHSWITACTRFQSTPRLTRDTSPSYAKKLSSLRLSRQHDVWSWCCCQCGPGTSVQTRCNYSMKQ